MTAPGVSEASPEPREEEQEILLRLGDILPRVPAHLLKPGPHDTMAQVRFSVDELAEKISKGRVSVPLERLASVCPAVFRDSDAFPGEQEIQLPLQKLLEQVGLVAPKPPGYNGIPKEQIAEARAQASRIIETASAPEAPPITPAAPVAQVTQPGQPADPPTAPQPLGIAKAFSTARQFLGIFGRPSSSLSQAAVGKDHTEVKQPVTEKQITPPNGNKAAAAPATPGQSQPVPPDCIALRVLPIFRLLPTEILRDGAAPAPDARAVLPLSAIDSQLAGGHVEIPLDDFIKALPENLRGALNPVPETLVWIPLDEIFQSLPPDHLFYMPPLAPLTPSAEPADAAVEAPTETLPEKANIPASDPEPAKPADEIGSLAPEEAPPETTLDAAPPIIHDAPAEAVANPADDPPSPPAPDAVPAPETPKAEAAPLPPPEEAAAPSPEPPTPEPIPAPAEAATLPVEPPPVEATPASDAVPTPADPPPPAQSPSRAPWMRGFQVPPPILLSGSVPPTEAPAEPVSAEAVPPPAPTPEAKSTVDFLASQPGIFAAAAFVQGAVFASADFPRKPDLDALRDFMGAFVDQARESGQRLGWNRILTLACEHFHATAVVRDSHFIVALHHDRVLQSLAYDAVIAAADDLSKAAV